MAHQVLSRKWRSKTFQEVVGQDPIIKSLQNTISRNCVGHAYLFTGSRGTGKTSVARIFSQALRCENLRPDNNACGECPSCKDFLTTNSMNVLEIDGASNNSVENIRELISNVHYLPTSGTYKIYIIDEVHMLSTSAFNALLKTLEEPPAHVIFIFATTEPEKVLGTVLARCLRFDFRNAAKADLISHLEYICKEEEVTYSSPVILEKIAAQARGSFRDSLSLLEQALIFSDGKNIDDEVLSLSLGLAKTSALKNLTTLLLSGDAAEFSSSYFNLVSENISIKNIYRGVLDHLFQVIQNFEDEELLIKEEVIAAGVLGKISIPELLWIYETLAKDMTWILTSLDPEKIALIEFHKICRRATFFEIATQPPQSSVPASTPEPVTVSKPIIESVSEPIQNRELEKEPEVKKKTEKKKLSSWDDFLAYLYKISPASASNLEQGNVLTPISSVGGKLRASLGFGQAEKVFYDYLQEREVHKKLIGFMADFFEVLVEDIQIDISLMDDAEKAKSNFQSKAEIQEQEYQSSMEQRKEKMANNPLVKEAEKVFNTKVDKVIINKIN